jgi:Domain of unknown function (DUF4292)
MKMRSSSVTILAFALLVFGCRGRKTQSHDLSIKGIDKAEAVSMHHGSHLRFQVLTLKGKATLEDYENDSQVGFNYRIDIAKDSLILLSIHKFGIPAMSISLAKDTVRVKFPISQTATVCDYQLLRKMTGMDFDLARVQNYLLGDADLAEPILLTPSRGKTVEFQGSRGSYEMSWMLDSQHFRLERMRISDTLSNLESVLTYSEFEKIEGRLIASLLRLEVTQPQTARISLHHTGIEFDKENVDFRFRIPPAYTTTACEAIIPPKSY